MVFLQSCLVPVKHTFEYVVPTVVKKRIYMSVVLRYALICYRTCIKYENRSYIH